MIALEDLKTINALVARLNRLRDEHFKAERDGKPTFVLGSQIAMLRDDLYSWGVKA